MVGNDSGEFTALVAHSDFLDKSGVPYLAVPKPQNHLGSSLKNDSWSHFQDFVLIDPERGPGTYFYKHPKEGKWSTDHTLRNIA